MIWRVKIFLIMFFFCGALFKMTFKRTRRQKNETFHLFLPDRPVEEGRINELVKRLKSM